ncbi:hypothetical protein BH09PSE6_BH09PSE6_15480 [soil metagenome]
MRPASILAVAALAAAFTGNAFAQGRPPGGPGPGRGQFVLDARYHHDHYYPRPGYTVGALPGGAVAVGWRGGNYYYHGGVWFRPYGRSYIVAAPPPGIFVPLLPPAYTTVWYSGSPYYYANGVYYSNAGAQGYTVVAPPPGAEGEPAIAQAPPPPPPTLPPPPQPQPPVQRAAGPVEPIVYPRQGQTFQQTEADRADCNAWANGQPRATSDISVFQRAFAACLDGRGYTVR